jgi:hypothetical protein
MPRTKPGDLVGREHAFYVNPSLPVVFVEDARGLVGTKGLVAFAYQ